MSPLLNSDLQIVLMDRMNPKTVEQVVSDHLQSVATNTDLANKEIWFVAQNIEDFIFAFESDMQTPTGTAINKRLIFLATPSPNWQEQLIHPIHRGRRILCITDNARVRRVFWVLVWQLQLKRQLDRWLVGSSLALSAAR
jgi:hypothetical protein